MTRDIINFGLRLMLVCAIAAAGLGLTYGAVEKNIEKMEKEEREEGASEVLEPAGLQALEITADNQEEYGIDLDSLESEFIDLEGVFIGLDEAGRPAGYAFIISSKGYNIMTLAVGIDADGSIIGVTVVKQEETPGLGSVPTENVEYLANYQGLGPDPLQLGVDVDAWTGATFTSNGILKGVNMALQVFDAVSEGK